MITSFFIVSDYQQRQSYKNSSVLLMSRLLRNKQLVFYFITQGGINCYAPSGLSTLITNVASSTGGVVWRTQLDADY